MQQDNLLTPVKEERLCMHIYPSIWVSAYKVRSLVYEHVAPVREKYLCQRSWTTDLLCRCVVKYTYIASIVLFVHPQKHCQCVWMRRLQTHSFMPQLCSSSAQFSKRRRRVGLSGIRPQTVNLLLLCVMSSEAHQQGSCVTFYCRYVGNAEITFIQSLFEIIWSEKAVFTLTSEFWEEDLSGPFKEVDSKSSDDIAGLQSCSSNPCS